ncbi:MAG: L,D-transpeptidase [Myxococcota bacterium]
MTTLDRPLGRLARLIAFAATGLLVLAVSAPAFARSGAGDARRDPGIRFEIDRASYRVHVVDLKTGEKGPEVPVAIGSPAHPSPTGEFKVWQVVHDPAWNPGRTARSLGARRVPAGPDGPLGVAKIPIQGEYALHGGANWLTVGKPLTLGCLRATDASILELIAWLESRGALAAKAAKRTGEKPQPFTRPARFVIR